MGPILDNRISEVLVVLPIFYLFVSHGCLFHVCEVLVISLRYVQYLTFLLVL
jgi:hypothetical protein